MFYIIGLGLCDEKDITLRGLEVTVALSYPVPHSFSDISTTGRKGMLTSLS